MADEQHLDPERHLKRLQKVFGVSKKIQELALSAIKEDATSEEMKKAAEALANAKIDRIKRMDLLNLRHQFIIDSIAEQFNVISDELIQGIADEDIHVNLLHEFVEKNGSKVLIFFYDQFPHPPKDSGRYIYKERFNKMLRAKCSDGTDTRLCSKSIIVYRNDNNQEMDQKMMINKMYFCQIHVDEDETISGALLNLYRKIIVPSCDSLENYGLCTPVLKKDFILSLIMADNFFLNSEKILKSIVEFNIDHDLYKGHLLVPYQIESTAQKPHLVLKVEKCFIEWMRQIERILIQCKQIRRDKPTGNPLDELNHWRQTLALYTSVNEFVESKPFCHHNKCLTYSRSKLLSKWLDLNDDLNFSMNIAANNVKFIASLEKFYTPLYRDPSKMHKYFNNLFKALRSVYNTSKFFNTSNCIASFLAKCTNHVTIVCQKYLSNDENIFLIEESQLRQRMNVCHSIMKYYRMAFDDTMNMMKQNEEKVWDFSPTYVFGLSQMFTDRLNKIQIIVDTRTKYSILNRVYINGIESFSKHITLAHDGVVRKQYDHTNPRELEFESDYTMWMERVKKSEVQMQKHVKNEIENYQGNLLSALKLVKRFEELGFECLTVNRRYFDIAIKFETEMSNLKDKFNLNKSNPPLPRGCATYSGRVLWVRHFQYKLNEIMDILKMNKCVTEHKDIQSTVKLYNSLTSNFILYEMMQHKAWYDQVHTVFDKLAQPILKKDSKTNRLQVNFNSAIDELVKESETMMKLRLGEYCSANYESNYEEKKSLKIELLLDSITKIPHFSQVVVTCRDKFSDTKDRLLDFLSQDIRLRNTLDMIFVNISRPILRRLEIIFKPSLTRVQWMSKDLDIYMIFVDEKIAEIGDIFKRIKNMSDYHIMSNTKIIANAELIDLPDEAIDMKTLLERNIEHRKIIEKEINKKSMMAEKSAIELIQVFLNLVEVSGTDENGQCLFSLPDDQIDEKNWRTELKKPIDKFDWITFDKIFQNVFMYPESERKRVWYKDYEKMSYGLVQLHNDCMELFSFFANECIESMVIAIKKALEVVKKHFYNSMTPCISTTMKLTENECTIYPSMEDINKQFLLLVQNIIETFYGVSTWGMQAKTEGRKKRKPLIDEVRHEKNLFKLISEHKEISRAMQTFNSGLLSLQPLIDAFSMKIYCDNCYLWANDIESSLKEFTESDPLIADIRDKFKEFDEKTLYLQESEKIKIFGSIIVDLNEVYTDFIEYSKQRKIILGRYLTKIFNKKMKDCIDFIEDIELILERPLNDLDDISTAMRYLEKVREKDINVEMDIMKIVEVYGVLSAFDVDVTPEDLDNVSGIQLRFNEMIDLSNNKNKEVDVKQRELLEELKFGLDNFPQEIDEFNVDFETRGPMVEGIPAKDASDRAFLFQGHFDELWRKYEMYQSGQRMYAMEVTEHPILNQRKKEFNLLTKLYSLYLVVIKKIDGYAEMSWKQVNMVDIIAEVSDFQTRCRQLPKAMQSWAAFIDLKKKIDDFNETCPLLELMTSESMKDRHWDRMNEVLNYDFDVNNPKTTLGYVLQAPLLEFKDEVLDICVSADKERDIESKLNQIMFDWSSIKLTFAFFKSRGELLLKGAETLDVIAMVEDGLMVMNSLATNRYNKPFKKEVMLWLNKLSTTAEILEKWMQLQGLWVYLEAVFVGGDISKQLPQEAKRFSAIDKSYVKLVMRAREVMNVVETCTSDDTMTTMLPYLIEQLESCQKSLTGYLETKRMVFPRFFFLSDQVLLEILGQASNPTTIQPHLLSIFDAVAAVDFQEKTIDKIVALNSANGEKVYLDNVVSCSGGVENWLNKLLFEMQSSIQSILGVMAMSLYSPDLNFTEDFQEYSGQAGLVGVQILWTIQAEYAIKKSRNDPYIMKKTNQLFLDLLNQFIELTIKDLSKLDRVRFETMVTIHVHQRDIFDEICKTKIKNIGDFQWQKQARFYYESENDEVIVKITDVDFIYQNEYLGVTDRLVITPLTDRCYITLAQALGMSLGGAPAGPAGTGKTETTKDMGRALGKFVVVFNCSDQMDFRGLGRIFKGLAQSGCWGCFDEFNRIELPVLSVAAQQISLVLTARRDKKQSFVFSDGDIVTLNPELGMFLTMNPGYAGRQELPENLKIMFRSVAMMVPDRQIIMRVKLASCGFKENVVLARKFFTLYKLCEEQLSKQVHYDFGLRNILSVLRTLGAQKRANASQTEETIVMRVLRDMNISKLVDEDEPLFLSLISDLFPGIVLSTFSYKELQKTIASIVDESGLVNPANWNLKVIQLYETSLVRHGLMTMGPTGSGKTTCTRVLMKAFTKMGQLHVEMRMNPKAISAPQMFGRLDVATNDWTDGIFSVLWRRTLKIDINKTVWLILDGPVDAVWIENLNSVLDDNKTLTLANGDRIVMAPNCKLVFEPDNVDNASPATVSRVGMVFMSSSVLSWQPLFQAWIKKRSNIREVLEKSFNDLYKDVELFVKVKLRPKMNILEAVYIQQMLTILDGLLVNEKNYSKINIQRIFLFALMWSLGAVLEIDDRRTFQLFVTDHPSKMPWPKPERFSTIFEYFINEKGDWNHWNNRVEPFYYPDDRILEYSNILVPNVDNTRTAFLINTVANQNKAILLIGEQGSAKTVMIKGYMSSYDPEVQVYKGMNFSSATTHNMFQRSIESYVEKRVGLSYGPPNGTKMSVFVDDINMPTINEWNDQPTNEVVRQLMEQGGFYSLDRPGDFLKILDLQFLAAMIHPGGGRNDIPHRLKRRFVIYNCSLPSESSMDQIFGQIAQGYFCEKRFNKDVVKFVSKLVKMTRILWQQTKLKMLPTPAKFHYIFNLRDLSRIWQGILTIKGPECTNVDTLLSLWRHECCRVISDRFINFWDKEWFENKIEDVVNIEVDRSVIPNGILATYFVDFLRDAPEATGDEEEDFTIEAPKIYEKIPPMDNLKLKLNQFMSQFNEIIRGYALDLVFFYDCIVHLIIISRIIRTPGGNALLVGVGGSGKQSITRLASFVAGYQFYQITITRSYNTQNLLEDLKILYRTSGLEGAGVTFIFTDNEIKDENFLEYINNVLSSGEVANLFAKDEIDEIVNEIEPILKKVEPNVIRTRDNCYDFFLRRAKSNLHVALCFSPIGEKFRNRSQKFPGLISGCTIDWFQKWPEDARVGVSRHFLQNYSIACTDDVKSNLIETMSFVHDFVSELCGHYFEKFRRQTFVTPKTLLSFLESYKKVYKEKYDDIQLSSSRMQNGLQKLVEAASSVALLKEELIEKNVEIEAATKEADAIVLSVAKVTESTMKIKEEVMKIKNSAEELVRNIEEDKEIAESKLALAQPALDEASAALNTITAADIATVKKLGKPPYLIMLIMDVCLILFRRKVNPVKMDLSKAFIVPSWNEAIKVFAESGFLQKIVRYPTDQINEEIIDLMVPYLANEIYTFEKAKIACGNVAGLLKWTVAMTDFFAVNKDVLPLKANLAIQQAKYERASAELAAAQDQFVEKEKELNEALSILAEAEGKKAAVLEDARLCAEKMNAATALIDGLSDERTRWTEQIAIFRSETNQLVGDIILLTAFLSYTGPFNQEYRNMCLTGWEEEISKRNVPKSNKINIIASLSDMATIGEWNVKGLPNDELSTQNGIIVTKASRYPLLIDPQIQGKVWIKNLEKENGLIVTTLDDRFFRNHIEDAVSLGQPILIEDIYEELDPALDNILEKNLLRIGTSFKLKFGDKEIDYHQSFRLYITTKLANPVYTPEISAKTSIIDFAVTMIGLEDQLLGRVIMSERCELEEERVNLIHDVNTNRRKMKDLETNLLFLLSTTQGSLLDDVNVINVLNVSKTTSTEVERKLETAKDTEIKINEAREEFREVAHRGSVLYFLVCTMSMVNNMYQTSLVQFLERFDISMENSTQSASPQKRIINIIKYLDYDIYAYISRGLFENHKFLFALLMALNIDIHSKKITFTEFQMFIKGGSSLGTGDDFPKPSKWIPDQIWSNVLQLMSLDKFNKLPEYFTKNEKIWKIWIKKDRPEDEIFPGEYAKYNEFNKLLLIKMCCPDRIYAQSRKYIAWSLGERFASSVTLNFEKLHADSRPLKPLVCFLTMGSDPTSNIFGLAKKQELHCHAISMGQGQEIHARKLLEECLVSGDWVLLQNCHLGLDYMNELVIKLLVLEKGKGELRGSFRVWLTTEVHPKFPISLLQQSIKYTNEPPSGMKAGLERTYGNLSQDLLDHSDSPLYLPLIYAISFLHTVVQERRKFGPLGWNIPYEFNSADWLASCIFVQNHLEGLEPNKGVSWSTLRYMLGEVNYGGRVTDDYDKRLLITFAKCWFIDQLYDEQFEFFSGYKIYNFRNQDEYLVALAEMNTVDPPQVYGLHPNADITYETKTATEILDTIITIQPKESSSSDGETREATVARVVNDILEKFPEFYNAFEVMNRIKDMGLLNPMVIFLRQEIDRMQKILKLVKSSLNNLLLSIDGTIIMNEQLQDAFDNIYNAKIPAVWKRGSWESSTLGFWFSELLARDNQLKTWCFEGRPAVFWMPGLFNPQGFITAMRQEVTRAHKGWALDTVTIHNEVTKMSLESCIKSPREGVYVHGLFLDGAGWDTNKIILKESLNKVLFTQLPVIHIYAINSTAQKDPSLYQCPVYKKPKRTDLNFITPLWLKTTEKPEHWILRGVAILCDIN